jgi:2-dehydro-3-deoxyphosphogluconate aldolase/(4S)-4-hydroxy-2-oxoglutarate aldolase
MPSDAAPAPNNHRANGSKEPSNPDAAAIIRQQGLVAILRTRLGPQGTTDAARAIFAAGVRAVEVTLDSVGALAAIERLRSDLPAGCTIGAGTIRSVGNAADAQAAGAQFLVAPCFQASVSAHCRDADTLYIPGVQTASEAQAAFDDGWSLQKLFPAGPLGADYLSALKAPLSDVDFIAVGGITPSNLVEFLNSGAVAVGLGSSLLEGSGPTGDPVVPFQRARIALELVGAAVAAKR